MENTTLSTKDKAANLFTGKITKENTITTLEIAEMMESEHKSLLRKLEGDKSRKGYIAILTEHQMSPSDYFIPATYRDASGKENKCYEVTKLGCDFLANKFTGEKGILFTARYVKRFDEMERGQVPKDFPSALRAYADELERRQIAEQEREKLQIELDYSKDWYSIKRVAAINGVDWKIFNWRLLKEKSIELGYGVKKIFDANYGEVNTYHRDVWETTYPEYEI